MLLLLPYYFVCCTNGLVHIIGTNAAGEMMMVWTLYRVTKKTNVPHETFIPSLLWPTWWNMANWNLKFESTPIEWYLCLVLVTTCTARVA